MLTLFVLVPVILFFLAIRLVTRLLFGFSRPYRRGPFGYSNRYSRHRNGFGGGLLSILSLVAFDRIFLDRRW